MSFIVTGSNLRIAAAIARTELVLVHDGSNGVYSPCIWQPAAD